MSRSHVVTGAGRGIGRAIVERLLRDGDAVVAVDLDAEALAWAEGHPAGGRLIALAGDAGDEALVSRAAEIAEDLGILSGWVNNAAVFRDASVHTAPAQQLLDLIVLGLRPSLVGCAAAIRSFLAAGTMGAIVNVSSHQAQRAVPGCLPYATAKAAIEGMTRSLAVEYGPSGIRVNAVALGSIATERYASLLAGLEPEAAARIERELRLLHPLGRPGRPEEVAATVSYLLSQDSSFVSGATLPVDGGRAALGLDPESHDRPGD
jgi:NAD(P)-dependent dehydrogenase (short-subunit alcohol dehydrogenase family)